MLMTLHVKVSRTGAVPASFEDYVTLEGFLVV